MGFEKRSGSWPTWRKRLLRARLIMSSIRRRATNDNFGRHFKFQKKPGAEMRLIFSTEIELIDEHREIERANDFEPIAALNASDPLRRL